MPKAKRKRQKTHDDSLDYLRALLRRGAGLFPRAAGLLARFLAGLFAARAGATDARARRVFTGDTTGEALRGAAAGKAAAAARLVGALAAPGVTVDEEDHAEDAEA